MSDIEFARELIKYFGWRRAAELFGLCTLMALSGIEPDRFEETVPVERTTWWRVRRDIKRFGDHLRAEGKLVDGDEVSPERLRRASGVLAAL